MTQTTAANLPHGVEWPKNLSEWRRYLMTYQEGEVWAIWIDGERLLQMCRLQEEGVWATPIGHMEEIEMGYRGWKRITQ